MIKKNIIFYLAFTIVTNSFSNNLEDFGLLLEESYKLIGLEEVRKNNENLENDEKITGKGIGVGIVDSPINYNHPSLKDENRITPSIKLSFPWNSLHSEHGTHVAGIAVGAKLSENEPYGIAHEATLYGIGINSNRNGQMIFPNENESNYLLNTLDVRVINNSWGSLSYPLINKQVRNGFFTDYIKAGSINHKSIFASANPMSRKLANLAREKKL